MCSMPQLNINLLLFELNASDGTHSSRNINSWFVFKQSKPTKSCIIFFGVVFVCALSNRLSSGRLNDYLEILV